MFIYLNEACLASHPIGSKQCTPTPAKHIKHNTIARAGIEQNIY